MTIAEELSTLVSALIGAPLPVRLRAWDDSETGPDGDAPVLHIRDKNALRRLLWRPGELGLAQAYISGEIDVIGDLAEGLGRVWRLAGSAAPPRGPRARLAALPFCLRHGILGPRPSDPDLAAKVSGRLHSRERDQAAIAFHYDLSNDFYQRLLDPRMVYSCGYWTEEKPEYGLADAQRDKLDLVCRKLGLRPGSRLLDIGCGWGALAIHAALHYGATVVGVTLSKRQHDFAVERARQVGADDAVTLRLGHWRDVTESGFDAVSAIEIGEHIG
ncbi:MAG: class I SAM-dependent methyltransferase, partial [Stackebrandtia sp.]